MGSTSNWRHPVAVRGSGDGAVRGFQVLNESEAAGEGQEWCPAAATLTKTYSTVVGVAVAVSVPPQLLLHGWDGTVVAREPLAAALWDMATVYTAADQGTPAATSGSSAAVAAAAAAAASGEHHVLLAGADGVVVGATINLAGGDAAAGARAGKGTSSTATSAQSPIKLTKTWPRRGTAGTTVTAAGSGGAPPVPNSVLCVRTNPLKTGFFLTADRQGLHCWSLSNSTAPTISDNDPPAPHSALDWSPHDANMIVAGYADGRLSVLDARFLAAPATSRDKHKWTVTEAHRGVVRDVRWSPFVSYWVASAGDDAVIRIWDIRTSHQPVRELKGHINAVLSVRIATAHSTQHTRIQALTNSFRPFIDFFLSSSSSA